MPISGVYPLRSCGACATATYAATSLPSENTGHSVITALRAAAHATTWILHVGYATE